MVIPRSRSAFNLSSTHAYLKEPLPSSAASFINGQQTAMTLACCKMEYFEIFQKGYGAAKASNMGYPTTTAPPIEVVVCFACWWDCDLNVKKYSLTFSNFSIVRLSIPPHL